MCNLQSAIRLGELNADNFMEFNEERIVGADNMRTVSMGGAIMH